MKNGVVLTLPQAISDLGNAPLIKVMVSGVRGQGLGLQPDCTTASRL
jgi:hypothetical protein